jgi:hypothetical protein
MIAIVPHERSQSNIKEPDSRDANQSEGDPLAQKIVR